MNRKFQGFTVYQGSARLVLPVALPVFPEIKDGALTAKPHFATQLMWQQVKEEIIRAGLPVGICRHAHAHSWYFGIK